jgi:hypothetical protein
MGDEGEHEALVYLGLGRRLHLGPSRPWALAKREAKGRKAPLR